VSLTRPKRGDEAWGRAYRMARRLARARRISGARRSRSRPSLWGECAPGPMGAGGALDVHDPTAESVIVGHEIRCHRRP